MGGLEILCPPPLALPHLPTLRLRSGALTLQLVDPSRDSTSLPLPVARLLQARSRFVSLAPDPTPEPAEEPAAVLARVLGELSGSSACWLSRDGKVTVTPRRWLLRPWSATLLLELGRHVADDGANDGANDGARGIGGIGGRLFGQALELQIEASLADLDALAELCAALALPPAAPAAAAVPRAPEPVRARVRPPRETTPELTVLARGAQRSADSDSDNDSHSDLLAGVRCVTLFGLFGRQAGACGVRGRCVCKGVCVCV